jgi:hypothetical protein
MSCNGNGEAHRNRRSGAATLSRRVGIRCNVLFATAHERHNVGDTPVDDAASSPRIAAGQPSDPRRPLTRQRIATRLVSDGQRCSTIATPGSPIVAVLSGRAQGPRDRAECWLSIGKMQTSGLNQSTSPTFDAARFSGGTSRPCEMCVMGRDRPSARHTFANRASAHPSAMPNE